MIIKPSRPNRPSEQCSNIKKYGTLIKPNVIANCDDVDTNDGSKFYAYCDISEVDCTKTKDGQDCFGVWKDYFNDGLLFTDSKKPYHACKVAFIKDKENDKNKTDDPTEDQFNNTIVLNKKDVSIAKEPTCLIGNYDSGTAFGPVFECDVDCTEK